MHIAKFLLLPIGVFSALSIPYNSAVCMLQKMGSRCAAIVAFVEMTAQPTPCSSLEASVKRVLSYWYVCISSLKVCLKSELEVSILLKMHRLVLKKGSFLVQGGILELLIGVVIVKSIFSNKGFNVCGTEGIVLGLFSGTCCVKLINLDTGLFGFAETLAK